MVDATVALPQLIVKIESGLIVKSECVMFPLSIVGAAPVDCHTRVYDIAEFNC